MSLISPVHLSRSSAVSDLISQADSCFLSDSLHSSRFFLYLLVLVLSSFCFLYCSSSSSLPLCNNYSASRQYISQLSCRSKGPQARPQVSSHWQWCLLDAVTEQTFHYPLTAIVPMLHWCCLIRNKTVGNICPLEKCNSVTDSCILQSGEFCSSYENKVQTCCFYKWSKWNIVRGHKCAHSQLVRQGVDVTAWSSGWMCCDHSRFLQILNNSGLVLFTLHFVSLRISSH